MSVLAPGTHGGEGGLRVVNDKFYARGVEKSEGMVGDEADDLEDDIGGGVEAGHLKGWK